MTDPALRRSCLLYIMNAYLDKLIKKSVYTSKKVQEYGES
jgi:hypothetical protein